LQNLNQKIKLVVNPAAGSSKTAKKWPETEKKLTNIIGKISIEFTKEASHATLITRHAIQQGYETIIAVGGDGTINEVVNGFFENAKQINPEASLGIIAMGTGGDLVRTLGIPKNVEDAATKIKTHKIKKCDLGFMKCQSLNGKPVTRYFINVADAGFGGTLTNLSYQSTKVFGTSATYLIALLKTLFVHETTPVEIKVDDSFSKEQVVRSVVIANGQYFGGGMRIAPKARIDDGLFDIVILGNLTPGEVLGNIHKLYNGTMVEHAKVQNLQGKKVNLNSESEVLIETDGELPGRLPASFEILPSVLNVIC